ncbi:unnamed protein product, partial [Musa textilis]
QGQGEDGAGAYGCCRRGFFGCGGGGGGGDVRHLLLRFQAVESTSATTTSASSASWSGPRLSHGAPSASGGFGPSAGPPWMGCSSLSGSSMFPSATRLGELLEIRKLCGS